MIPIKDNNNKQIFMNFSTWCSILADNSDFHFLSRMGSDGCLFCNVLFYAPTGFVRSYGNQTWPIKWNAISSRLRSCRYCCMDALLGPWLNGWRRSSTAINTLNVASNIEQVLAATPHTGANCTATYHLSQKLYKLDEPDMPDTAGEAKTRS